MMYYQGTVKVIQEYYKSWIVENPELFYEKLEKFMNEHEEMGWKTKAENTKHRLHLIAWNPKEDNGEMMA